jgi:predicted RNase H-like HicB family nuclease
MTERKIAIGERSFEVQLTQEADDSDGEVFVALCMDPDLVSQGRTEEEAIAMLREAIELYFTED